MGAWERTKSTNSRQETMLIERDGATLTLAVRPARITGEDGTSYGQIGAGLMTPEDDFGDYYTTVRYGPGTALGALLHQGREARQGLAVDAVGQRRRTRPGNKHKQECPDQAVRFAHDAQILIKSVSQVANTGSAASLLVGNSAPAPLNGR